MRVFLLRTAVVLLCSLPLAAQTPPREPAGPQHLARVRGPSTRLRIEETYTDPARYALIDGQLMWHRSFGRPRNDIVLPAGWRVTTNSIPATVALTDDGRIRLAYVNPRPDSIDVFVKARPKR